MKATLKLHGAAELEKVLRQLPAEVARRDLTASMRAGAQVVRLAVSDAAPVRTEGGAKRDGKRVRLPGYLKFAIVLRVVKRGAAAVQVLVGVGRGYYGAFLEFGTRHQAARPWFRPAWEASKEAAVNAIGLDLGKRLERTAKRLAGPYSRARKLLLR